MTFPARQPKFARPIRVDKLHIVLSAGVGGAATCQGSERNENEEKVGEGLLHIFLDVLQLKDPNFADTSQISTIILVVQISNSESWI